ncbi:MAG: DUF4194 domain-containing protein [Archangiaceae bacterium]|nr:DUF4194 domain-containing protein [Archangiaceae bacterium]
MTPSHDAFPSLLIGLMKGVVWREDDAAQWGRLLTLQSQVRDHVSPLGLDLVIDEGEGYSLLRQRPAVEGSELPRLIPRRPLSYPVSLLLVLLRKKLAEADGTSGDPRVVLRREELIEMLRHFLKDGTNDAKLVDHITAQINKVRDLGFLRPLKGRDGEYEVVRLLKTFVDAEFLEGLLTSYRSFSATQAQELAE